MAVNLSFQYDLFLLGLYQLFASHLPLTSHLLLVLQAKAFILYLKLKIAGQQLSYKRYPHLSFPLLLSSRSDKIQICQSHARLKILPQFSVELLNNLF